MGEMKNVLIRLSANSKICQFIDITVADIPSGYSLRLFDRFVAQSNQLLFSVSKAHPLESRLSAARLQSRSSEEPVAATTISPNFLNFGPLLMI